LTLILCFQQPLRFVFQKTCFFVPHNFSAKPIATMFSMGYGDITSPARLLNSTAENRVPAAPEKGLNRL